MAFTPRTRLINPRLGMYFGIFASAFAALVLLNLIFEQLGVADQTLRLLMLLVPLALYAGVGLASFTNEPLEYFAAGRRVPAVYGGLGLAVTALGSTGLVALTGSLFFIGFDAICLISGGLAGFVIMAVLLAPFLRKFGAFTTPSYLGRRFNSRLLRIVAAALLAVPTLLMLSAEVRVGVAAAQWLTGYSVVAMTVTLVGAVILSLFLGGMRSLTWTSVAATIAAILALIIPVAAVAVLLGYLPVPQFSHGPLARAVARAEAVQALPVVVAPVLAFEFPADGFQAIAKRFTSPFGVVGPGAYILLMLTVMFGVSSAPWLLPRVATAPGVYEARKSLGWATVFFGLIAITCVTIAIFMRFYLVKQGAGTTAAPATWLSDVIKAGFAEIGTKSTRLLPTGILFDRDSILLSLPIAAGLPKAFAYMAAAGVIAASVAAAGATALSLSNLLSEDIVNGLSWEPPAVNLRLNSARILLAVIGVFGGVIAMIAPTDPLKLLLWALILTGSTAFPVLVLSIWWKRTNVFGAFAGMTTGFAVAVLLIVSAEAGWIALASPLAGALSLPASVIATIFVSATTVPATSHEQELVRDIRVPGGEILYDREMRLLRLKERKRA